MLEKYPEDLKLVFKSFPLNNHEFSRKAARAALAAEPQGQFWDFHDLLFMNHDGINDQKIEEIAAELDLDLREFHEEMIDPRTDARIQRDLAEGQDAGVAGTPTIFVNGKLVRFQSMADIVGVISTLVDHE